MMTSRERVVRCIQHNEADRVPIDYMYNPGIHARLKQHFDLSPEDDEGVLQALNVDFRMINADYCGDRLHPEVAADGVEVEPTFGFRSRWVENESGGFWELVERPLRDASLDEIAAWPMPDPDHFDYEDFSRRCEAHKERCVVIGGPSTGDIINGCSSLRGMEELLCDLVTDEEEGLLLIDRRHAVVCAQVRKMLEVAHEHIGLLWIGEDLGTQHAPLISLDLFRRHLRPRLQQLVDLGKEFEVPVMIHSCGSSSWAFEDFIEMGIDVVDTLQPEAANMSPLYLKTSYGDHLCFHGCISTAGALAYGTPEEVREDVRQTLEVMKPGGGYMLAPTHHIQDNSPAENVLALYEAAREFGGYETLNA